MADKSRIIADGRERFERTPEFANKVEEIKKEVNQKYALILLSERSWIRQQLTKIKLRIEVKRRIEELSSSKNLHLNCNYI
ncbi:MAG: hypothetical protein RIG62_23615 [Cyclobacteriaceae bacterium]